MKLLLVLLACVAATNALSYAVPSYRYFCSHHFVISPPSHSYSYVVYFPSTWCSSRYYSTILKVYPGDDCGKDGWTERSPTDVINEVKNLLKTALSKMTSEMYAKRNEWVRKIDAIHAEYKATYKKYLYQYYAYKLQCGLIVGINYIKERDGLINAYCAKLDKTKSDILSKFNAAIAAKIAAITKYHSEIVARGAECLNTRVKKIAEFKAASIQKVHDYIIKFAKTHLAIIKCNKEFYEKALHRIYDQSGQWAYFKADVAIALYNTQERMKVEKLLRVYAAKMGEYYKKLLNFYICAYKCYMSNACLRFFSKNYYSSCHTIKMVSCRTGYKYTRYSISPFCYNYRQCTLRKNLKTCDVTEDARNAQKVIADAKKQLEDILKADNSKFYAWKSQWVGYHIAYKNAYYKIVTERHQWYLEYLRKNYLACGGLTPAQISELAKLKTELQKKASQMCFDYYARLQAKITECYNKHQENQARFKKSVEDLIARLEAKYKECAAKKVTSIADYKKKLIESRDRQRAALVANLNKARATHFEYYNKMMINYHGEKYSSIYCINYMVVCYKSWVNQQVNNILSQFDAYWRDALAKLVLHYTCCYKCTIRACIPTYRCGTYYTTWKYCLPTYTVYNYHLYTYRQCFYVR